MGETVPMKKLRTKEYNKRYKDAERKLSGYPAFKAPRILIAALAKREDYIDLISILVENYTGMGRGETLYYLIPKNNDIISFSATIVGEILIKLKTRKIKKSENGFAKIYDSYQRIILIEKENAYSLQERIEERAKHEKE